MGRELFVDVITGLKRGVDFYRITHPELNSHEKVLANPALAVEVVVEKLKKNKELDLNELFHIDIGEGLIRFSYKSGAFIEGDEEE